MKNWIQYTLVGLMLLIPGSLIAWQAFKEDPNHPHALGDLSILKDKEESFEGKYITVNGYLQETSSPSGVDICTQVATSWGIGDPSTYFYELWHQPAKWVRARRYVLVDRPPSRMGLRKVEGKVQFWAGWEAPESYFLMVYAGPVKQKASPGYYDKSEVTGLLYRDGREWALLVDTQEYPNWPP